ncbi:peptidase [Nostoc sp. T09]|uniref:PepSY-associated TM helix domain-containing protein n=1 Tax=Nostoc sp. T09 TaxID=1932621 RepID=UPI000A3BD04F|nr:PepSY-associated TM helix domain-containing protein [Nostoc sp. T09]OUL32977.1 peptidase [Nostoc sp. T09]
MNKKQLRDITFYIHRYIGLIVGLILVVIGLTGSLLVFEPEIEDFLVAQKFGHVVPQQTPVSIDEILATINSAIAKQTDLKIGSIVVPKDGTSAYEARLWNSADKLTQVFIDPYTGKAMGSIKEDSNILQLALHLHYELLAGKPGQIIAGVTGLLLFFLSVTGIILWPGWRKLIAGFKIKWNAHPKRVNFDIHKLIGIIVAVFFALTGFTGFCWNFYDYSVPVIYAATFTPQPPELASQPIPGQSPLPLSQVLQAADAAIPNAQTTYIGIPDKPDKIIRVGKRQAHETSPYGESEVTLDQYTGKVLRVADSRSLALGDRFLNSFAPLHYGTYWGAYSRILYVLVGLSPSIMFVTGLVMWWYRRRVKAENVVDNLDVLQRH